MRKLPITVDGVKGWLCEPEDLEEYRATVLGTELMLKDRYFLIPPYTTKRRIVWEQDGDLRITTPSVMFFHMLRIGGYIRHMRVAAESHGRPVFEGTGDLLPSMTEDEALAFLAWKDIPRGTNRVVVVDRIPENHKRRKEWELNDDGVIVAP